MRTTTSFLFVAAMAVLTLSAQAKCLIYSPGSTTLQQVAAYLANGYWQDQSGRNWQLLPEGELVSWDNHTAETAPAVGTWQTTLSPAGVQVVLRLPAAEHHFVLTANCDQLALEPAADAPAMQWTRQSAAASAALVPTLVGEWQAGYTKAACAVTFYANGRFTLQRNTAEQCTLVHGQWRLAADGRTLLLQQPGLSEPEVVHIGHLQMDELVLTPAPNSQLLSGGGGQGCFFNKI